jgi:hypothetical protein
LFLSFMRSIPLSSVGAGPDRMLPIRRFDANAIVRLPLAGKFRHEKISLLFPVLFRRELSQA